jgi:hypothetical protein
MNQMNKFFVLLILCINFSGCSYNDSEPYYNTSEYVPILLKSEDLAHSVQKINARSLNNHGKILWMGNYLLIVEQYEGFHVVDNSQPANPQTICFVRVPGCIDLTSKNAVVYADNAVDLVAIDMSDINNIHETSRVPNVFPELLPPGEEQIPNIFSKTNRPANTVIVGWKSKEVQNEE